MPRVPILIACSVIVIAALGLAACGGTVIDDKKAEAAITDSLNKPNSKDKVTSVDCPSNVDVKAGTTFDCAVVYASGARASARLKIRNSDADVDFISLKPQK